MSPGLPRKHWSHGASLFFIRLPVNRTKSSMNHSMQRPITFCANAKTPLFAARGGAGELPDGVPAEVRADGCDACDLEAMTNAAIFAASGGLRESARGDLPLQLTAPIVRSAASNGNTPQRNPWL